MNSKHSAALFIGPFSFSLLALLDRHIVRQILAPSLRKPT